MKLIHLSDLHLGKRLFEFSLLEDQKYLLTEILELVKAEAPKAVIIAGDIYDKAVPSAEAVALLDDFLSRLSKLCAHIFIISGNHDAPERIAFGANLMEKSGVHLSPVYGGSLSPVTLSDEYGEADFYMLPFVKPANVRRFFPEEEIGSYTDAVRAALRGYPAPHRRSVLITHQFVTGGVRSDSEEVSVGGSDNVDVSVFGGFDYVALGHLHSAQSISRETVRYCGTPLKYSFSEARQQKGATVVTLGEAGSVSIRAVPLTPLRELRELRGSYAELTLRENYINTALSDYLHITLTDEEDIPDAALKLRSIYPNLMKLSYDNRRTRALGRVDMAEASEQSSPLELFAKLYEKQNGAPMSDAQAKLCSALIAEVWEENT